MSNVSRDRFGVLRAILTNQFQSEPPGEARIASVVCVQASRHPANLAAWTTEVLRARIASRVDEKLVVSDAETIALTTDGAVAAAAL